MGSLYIHACIFPESDERRVLVVRSSAGAELSFPGGSRGGPAGIRGIDFRRYFVRRRGTLAIWAPGRGPGRAGAGPMGPGAHGPMGPGARGPTGPKAHGPMGPRAQGPSGPWAHGPVGPLDHKDRDEIFPSHVDRYVSTLS